MGSHVSAPVLTPNVKYDSERDFEPIGFTAHSSAVIVARKDFPRLTRDIMPPRERVQALPGNEFLRDLPLERDAVGALSGHGFHPLKAQLTLSNH
jgi:hypothetical protein